MIDHARIKDQLFAYLDLDLDDAERAEFDRHLQACSECSSELEITRRANSLFKTIEPQPLPEGFMQRLQARLDEDASAVPLNGVVIPLERRVSALPPTQVAPSAQIPPRRSWARTRLLTAIAALVAAVFGLTFMFGLQPDPRVDVALAPAALAYSEGDIRLEHGGMSRTVTESVALQVGDVVATSENAKAVVTLGNGGSVRLAAGSRMRVLAMDASTESGRLDARLELENGSIWVEEAGGVHCALQAGSTLIIPLGTAYEAMVTNGESTVSVWEGKVQLSSPDGMKAAMQLVAGQYASLSASGLLASGLIDTQTALQATSFSGWNLRLQRPPHPTGAGPLARPTLMQSVGTPSWVSDPPAPPRQP